MPSLDLATFEKLGRPDKRVPCKIAAALEGLKPADAKVVDQALRSDNEHVRRGVRRWLESEHDVKLSSAAMTAHRQGQCRCGS